MENRFQPVVIILEPRSERSYRHSEQTDRLWIEFAWPAITRGVTADLEDVFGEHRWWRVEPCAFSPRRPLSSFFGGADDLAC